MFRRGHSMIERFAYCLLFVTTFSAHGAQAQAQGAVYLTAGVGLPTQQGSAIGPNTSSTAPAGTIFGGAIGAGVFLSRLASIEGEISRTRLIENQQNVRDFIMSERRRDNVITTLLRFHPQRGRRVQIEPVTGFAIAIPQSSYQTTGTDGKVQPKLDRQMPALVGLTMGVDARVGDERFSIVPSLRLRVTSGSPDEMIPKGYPRWTVIPGVAARIGVARPHREQPRSSKSTYLTGASGFSGNPAYTGVNGANNPTSPAGRTSAMMASGGVFLTRRLAFDIGFARAGVLKNRQGTRYGRTINDELRKNFVTAGVRFRIPVARVIHVEPVTAFLLTLHERVTQDECCTMFPGQRYTVGPRVRAPFPLSPGFASGVDVPVGNERVAFVPSLRLFFTLGNVGSYNGLYARLTWVPSFGIRLGF